MSLMVRQKMKAKPTADVWKQSPSLAPSWLEIQESPGWYSYWRAGQGRLEMLIFGLFLLAFSLLIGTGGYRSWVDLRSSQRIYRIITAPKSEPWGWGYISVIEHLPSIYARPWVRSVALKIRRKEKETKTKEWTLMVVGMVDRQGIPGTNCHRLRAQVRSLPLWTYF